jgi:hypothetical protein
MGNVACAPDPCSGHVVNGGRCKREAEPGSVVCHIHGGAAAPVNTY